MGMPELEIYSMIGAEGFARLVAAFYRQVPQDDLLGPMYPASDLPGAEQRLRDFLIGRFGGPRLTLNEEVIPASGRGIRRFPSIRPISRLTQAVYLPVLRLCLKYRKTTLLLNLVFLVVTFPLIFRMGSQFMPPLFEGSSLYMPKALPGIAITQASQLLQEQDRILRSFAEVETVFGVVGRSDSATDNAPLDMYDTTVMLKPRAKWPPG